MHGFNRNYCKQQKTSEQRSPSLSLSHTHQNHVPHYGTRTLTTVSIARSTKIIEFEMYHNNLDMSMSMTENNYVEATCNYNRNTECVQQHTLRMHQNRKPSPLIMVACMQ